jgi:uncharacterized protein YciI
MAYFVVINEQGPTWQPGRPMRKQPGWEEHAAFMDALEAERLVVLGGPLGGGPRHRAMLVLRAPDERAIRARLEGDPWVRHGVLQLGELMPWELLLGKPP